MVAARWREAGAWLRAALVSVLVSGAIVAPQARADAPPATGFPNTGAFTATFKSTRNHVAVMELSGDYSRDLAGQFNVEPRTVVAKEFYKHFADQYDFLVVFSNFEFNTGDAKAFYAGVRNDVDGLGDPRFDNSRFFGSQGRLQGYIDMAALSRYHLQSSDPRFEEAMRVLSHELLHRWAARVKFIGSDGRPSQALLGKDGSHWSFLLDTGGSVEYGNRWKDNGNGTFTSLPDRQFFSPLDLYLMGMLKKEEVPPFFYIENATVDPARLSESGVTISGVRRDVTIDQVIAAEGPRVPNAEQSQKQFRLGFVLLTRPGVGVSDEQLVDVDTVRKAFETRLTTLTAGRSLAHAYLEPKGLAGKDDPTLPGTVVGAPGSTANVSAALAWLRTKQLEAGPWNDHPLTRLRDTVVATAALNDVGPGDQPRVIRANAWLEAQAVGNTDYVARRILALSGKVADSEWARLAGTQNTDGGWGAAPGYQSTPLDSALAVTALALDPNPARQGPARERAKAFLLARQNADGGWSHTVNGVSRTATTAQVVRALANLDAAPQLAKASAFLAGRQNTDGGFGDSPSTTHDTSNVLLALASAGQLGAVRTQAGFNYLNATQQPDGSWDGSVYATGLAVRTLGAAQTYNWAASLFTATPASVRDGQVVALSMRVVNSSSVAAPASVVRVYDGDPSASVVVTDMPVPPLDPGAGVTVRGLWPTLNKAGNHLLTAVVDPATAGTEMTRADNTATLRVAVAPAPVQPDLTVAASDVQVLPSVINRLPTTVSVVTQLANIGQTDALNVKVRLLSGATAETMVVVDEKIVNLLGRSTVAVTTTFQVTKPGRQKLAVVIDADGTVPDIDTANNRAEVEIDTVSSFDPAVAASELVVPASPVTVGADVPLKATIRNHGTADTPPFQAVLTVTDGAVVREIDRIGVQLPPGGEKTFTLPWRVDLTGPLEFRVVLDPAGAVSDLDRTNNEARAAFSAVAPAAGPNLAVSYRDMTLSPDPALEGSPLTLKATVRNTGTQAVTNVEVGFYEGDPANGGRLVAPLQTVPALAAGGSAEVTAVMPKVDGTAERLFFVALDPAGRITEANREDNSAFLSVTVRSLPDLAISAGNVTLNPPAPKPGDTLTVTVDVDNLGQQPASAVLVRLLEGDAVIGEQTVALIAAQSAGRVTFSMNLPAQSAGRFLTVVVDPANTVVEGNEANNTAAKPLVVQSGAGYASDGFFSPNGDGVKDTVSFGFSLSAATVTKVVVINAKDELVRSFANLGTGPQSSGSVTWDGRDDFQRIVGDGAYRFRALSAAGSTMSEASVIADTNRTPILAASGTPAEYYRNLTCRAPQMDSWTTTLDEQSIFLASQATDRRGLYKVALQGGELTTVVSTTWLAAGGQPVNNISASARGDRVAFSRFNGGIAPGTGQRIDAYEVWTVKTDGSQPELLASGKTAAPAERFTYVQALTMAHDGAAVIATLQTEDGGVVVRRYPVDPAGGASRVLYDSRQQGMWRMDQSHVAPNRRRALLRLWNNENGDQGFAVLDYETGALHMVPAGLYPRYFNNTPGHRWSPDSQRFVLYGNVESLGVEEGNRIDFEFDVFDANFQLEKRFRTDKGPGDSSWYSGEVSGVEWSGQSDEFVFALDPRPYGWYGGEVRASDFAAASTPVADTADNKVFYRANLAQGKLVPVMADNTLLERSVPVWWEPTSRTAVIDRSNNWSNELQLRAVDVDSGAVRTLFPKWAESMASSESYNASMSVTEFAPSGRRLFFTSYRDGQNPASACYSPYGAHQLYAYESLHNLVADLQPLRDPRVGGLLMRGTAADINFSGWQLSYADTRAPNDWRAIAVPGTEQKIGATLATWVPPAYGTYFVRLTVSDRAGNSGAAIRRVTWSDTPPITDLVKDFDYISPNGDGVQDKVTLSYRVLEPVHLAFEVKREDGTRVRLIERDHATIGADFRFEWDGRDDEGRQVPDAKYTMRVLDYEFPVEIDTVFPDLVMKTSEHAFDYRMASVGDYVVFEPAALREAVPEIRFEVLEDKEATFFVRSLGEEVLERKFKPGTHAFAWDGLRSGVAVPAGTYQVEVRMRDTRGSSDELQAFFTMELRQGAGGVLTPLFRHPLMSASALTLPPPPAFKVEGSDRLLLKDSVRLEFGWGDPPATWTTGFGDGRTQSLPEGAFLSWDPEFSETSDGVSHVRMQGHHETLRFSGSRLRATLADRAGNAVSALSPHHAVKELVLFSTGLFPSKALFVSDQTPDKVYDAPIGAQTTFSPAPVFLGTVLPPDMPTDARVLGLELNFADNLVARAPRAELRYAFLPRPEGGGAQFVVPTLANMPLLAWTNVPVRGLAPTEKSTGVEVYSDLENRLAINWTLPHQQDGAWLFQLVQREADGNELKSSIHTIRFVTPSEKPVVPWEAHHEPSLVCDGPVSERAHVDALVPVYDPPRFPFIVRGKRLYHMSRGSRELLNESMTDNLQQGGFESVFSTATWTLGRHDFEVDLLIAGRWVTTTRPYLYVNHAPPAAEVLAPLEGQKMCATRIEVPNFGTIGYVPFQIRVEEPYSAYEDLQLQMAGERWEHRGPVSARLSVKEADGTQNPKKPQKVCGLEEGCGVSGPIVWPDRPGVFKHDTSRNLYGLDPDDGMSYSPAPLDGELKTRLRVYGPSGHLVCKPVSFSVDGRVEGSSSLDRGLFSPNGDGFLDDVMLTLYASEALTVKVEVLRASKGRDGSIVPTGDPIAVLASALSMNNGERSLPWEGRDNGGQVLPDGAYAIRVTMVDGCGNESIGIHGVEVDNTPPVIVIDSPKPQGAVPIEFEIKGTINDAHPLRYEIIGVPDANPDAGILLPATGGMNQLHTKLAEWNTTGLTGGAKLVVRASDTVGNHSVLEVPIRLTEPVEIITSLNGAPDPFSPNGDGRREKVSVLYSLSRAANLTMDLVRAGTGVKIRTVLDNVPAPAGNGAVVWDGRDQYGQVEPDGEIAIVLKAEAVVNGEVVARDTENAGVVLDKTAPVITYTQPEGPVTTGAAGVVVRAADPLLSTAKLSVSINRAPNVPLDEAQDESGIIATPLDDIPEGPITLRVDAEDRAENRSVGTLSVIIDRTPPKPAITAPKAGEFISGLKKAYDIEGGIEELHIKSWQLGLGGPPLLQGTALPVPGKLLTWDPKTVADGPYTLSLKAEDQAGLRGEAAVAVTVDNTLPAVSIKSTGSPMYVKVGTVLQGSATDVNFTSYRVELAPGGVNGTRWSEVGNGTAPITDGPLTSFAVLPADGVYGLRLWAIDKAGNENNTVQEITVDTVAPQAVTLTAEIRNRRDGDVKWTVANEADAAGYILFRNGSRVNTALLTTTSYVDVGLQSGSYTYVVKVVDKAGNESEPSNEGRVVVSSGEPVAQIFAPTRDAWAAGLMDVRGTAMSPADFKEYRLFVGPGATPSTWTLVRKSPLAITADTLSAWNTIGLVEGQVYTLRLEAEDLSGQVATDRVTVKVKNTPPNAPIQLQGYVRNNIDIPLHWTPNTEPDIQGYLLYRNQQLANATGVVIGSLVPYLIKPANFDDLKLPDGTHRYFVQAMDQAGNVSDPSNEVEFKIDNRPPHVPVVKPEDGTKVSQTATLVGESPDNDIARVQFQYKPEASSTWVDIDAPRTNNAGPWTIEWRTEGLPYGPYHVRAVATDQGGKTDPAPGFITLVLTDLRKPDPATTLKARVTGGDVKLDWVASGSSYATGYHLDRIDPDGATERVTADPIAGLTYTDTGRPDAAYLYRVVAVSAGGTESDSSNEAPAIVFTPEFEQPFTPTADAATPLDGRTRPAHRLTLRRAGGDDIATVDTDAEGRFAFADVPLALGDNRFELVAADNDGNTSKVVPWHAVRGLAPATPTGLNATVSNHDVTLTWAANTEADLDGYVPALDGVLRSSAAVPVSATASWTTGESYWAPDRAIDGDPDSGWQVYPANGQWLEVRLAQPRVVTGMQLRWLPWYPVYRYAVEGFDGEVWVPLARLENMQDQPNAEVVFARSYRSDRFRVRILESSYQAILNDLRLTALDVGATRSATHTNLPDGRPEVGVLAVSTLGLRSPLAQTRPSVGDVTGPDAPVLTARAVTSDAHLAWVGPSNTDVAGFEIRRNGELLGRFDDGTLRAFIDVNLPNAHYDYVVTAYDAVGNPGLASNLAGVDILVTGPNAPIAATAVAPAGGGRVVVDWTVGQGPQPGAFDLFRSVQAGGPFERIASGLSGAPYDDHDVVNGTRYHYVVKGVDGAGNVGATSNEVNARPEDRVPPSVPYFVAPGRSPGPVSTSEAVTPLAGYAEPGSQVVLSRGDIPIGTVDALWDDQQVQYASNNGTAFDLSADGELLYMNMSGSKVVSIDGSPVPSSALASREVQTFRFAPDAKSAAVTYYDNSTGRTVLARWDRAVDSLSIIAPSVESGLLVFSPDGKRVAVRSWDDAAGSWGLRVLDLGTGSSRFLPGSFTSAAWSPDNRTLAVTGDEGLQFVEGDAAPGAPVDALGGPESVAWLPDGQGVLVDGEAPQGGRLIARVRWPDGGVETVLSEPGVTFRSPVPSVEGDAFLVARDSQLVRRTFAGAEETVAWQVDTSYGSPVWTRTGTVGFLRGYGQAVIHTPAGYFRLPETSLAVGSNSFGAYAVDEAGNSSAPALPLEVRRLSASLPDWAVAGDAWTLFPATPRSGEATDIAVTVRNLGQAAPATRVSVLMTDEQGGIRRLYDGTLEAMAAHTQRTVRFAWTARDAGRYTLRVAVDADGVTDEVSETNNVALRDIVVTAVAGRPDVQVRTDKARYVGGETVVATVTTAVSDAAFDGTLVTRVVDTGGVELFKFDARPVADLRYGQPRSLTYDWPSGTTFAGDYRVEAVLLGADAQRAAEGAAAFTLAPGATFTAAVTTDRAAYATGDSVQVRGTVRHASGNVLSANTSAVLEVRSAAGEVLATKSEPFTGLLQGMEVRMDLGWTAVPDGAYTARLTVGPADAPDAMAEAAFTVAAPSVPIVAGKLTVNGDVFGTSEVIATTSALTNRGAPIEPLPVRVRAVEPVSAATLAVFAGDFAGVGQAAVQVPAALNGTWPLGGFEIRLEAQVGGQWVLLDRARVQAAERTPPAIVFTGPAPGAVVRSTATVTTQATPRQAPLASVEWLPVSGWVPMQPQNPSAGLYYGNGLPLADGPVTLQARATDTLSNVSSPATLAIVIDNTPPLIVVTGVVNGGTSQGAVTPVVSITDLHLTTTEVLLDGVPFVAGTVVSAPGSHTMRMKGADLAGNESEASVTFTIESPAVSLNGALGVSPDLVSIGETVVLDARVNNASTRALSNVAVKLVIRDRATGVVLQTYDDVTNLALNGSYQRAWSWTAAGTAGALLDAVLTATVDGNTTPIAQGTIQLTAPNTAISLQAALSLPKKMLVYVRCTKKEDDTWDNCLAPNRAFSDAATVASCTAERVTFMAQYLNGRGIAHTIVSDEAAFLSELRSGKYATYWVGGGALKLGTLAAAEVQAAVRRGDALVTEGWFPGRNTVLDAVAGVSFVGRWSSTLGEVTTLAPLMPAATLPVDVPIRFTTASGTSHGTIKPNPGIVASSHGRGRTMAFAFDLSGTLRTATAANRPTWDTIVETTLAHVARTAPMEIVGGGVVELKARVGNTGTTAQPLDYIAKVPAAVQVLGTNPAPTATTVEGGLPTLRWRATAAAGGSVDLAATLRAPIDEGEYVVSSLVNQINAGGSSTLLHNQQVMLKVHGPVGLGDAAYDQVLAVSVTAAEATAKAGALSRLSLAKLSIADGRWDDALRQLVAAQTSWANVAGTPADEAKLVIARAIEAVERRL